MPLAASLYLHVPFCAGACDYCDFYSIASSSSDLRLDRTVDRLIQDVETELQKTLLVEVPTVFLGGGTPSFLGAERMERLLLGLHAILPNKPKELSIEANPESVDEKFLEACLRGGATRISLGIQSLNDKSRRAVGRIGTASSARRALTLLASYFPGRFSVDLIAGLPYQGKPELLSEIDEILSSGASHISLYSLTLEEGTPLARRAEDGDAELPDNDEADSLFLAGRDALEAAGLAQYEISNFARSGSECLHNLRYWNMQSWLAVGPGASATVVDEERATAKRYSMAKDVDAWLAGSAAVAHEFIDTKSLMEECVLMGFRLRSGIEENLFKQRFGLGVENFIPRSLEKARKRGHLCSDRPALTREGLLFLDPFLLDCFSELGQIRR